MCVLIFLSAFFSGSEAALFSLTPRGRRRITHTRGGQIADGLLQDPDRLLSAILFWNLLINMTYFAIVAIVGTRLQADPNVGQTVAIAFTLVTLLAIVFFSEMLPKSIAVVIPDRFSAVIGVPLSVAVAIVSPILPLVESANQVARRLIWPTFESEPAIDLSDIDRAIELGTDDAALQQRDRIAFHGLVEMAEVRSAEIMRPRSKLLMCPQPVTVEHLCQETPPGGWVMVTDEDQKNIQAAIPVRHLRPSQMDQLEAVTESVIYVPWSSHVSQVWDQMDEADCSVAIVVNEFGEVVGAITIDDILRRVLAPRRSREDEVLGTESFQEIAPNHYRVLGSVSLRALAKRLGIKQPDETIATISGFVQRQNERFPRVGDEAELEDYVLRVVKQDERTTWIEVSRAPEDDSVSEESP